MAVALEPPRASFPAQRRARILDLLRREGAASVPHLAAALDASVATVRRDLEVLTREGYLARSHGGAVLKARYGTTFEPDSAIEAEVAQEAKARIGAAAADLVEDGQSIILDSSSTVLAAAERIAARDLRLTAVTNDLRIAGVLARAPGVTLVVPGGTLRPGSATLVGDPGLSFLATLHVDVALVGIHAIADGRLSETSIEVARMKQRMIAAAHRPILLADASKLREASFVEVCPLARMAMVVSDAAFPEPARAAVAEAGVDLLLAGEEGR